MTEIRRATEDDLDDVLPLFAGYQRFYTGEQQPDEKNRAFLRRFVGDEAGRLLIARDEETGPSAAELAEVAWEWLIEHQPPAPRGRDAGASGWGGCPESAVWTCTSCRARVRDTGPYEPHPADRD